MDIIKLMWLNDILDNFRIILQLSMAFGSLIGSIGLLITAIEGRDKKPFCKILLFFVPLVTFLLIVIPSEKTMYSLIALKAGKEVINTGIGQKAMLLLNKKLDEELKK